MTAGASHATLELRADHARECVLALPTSVRTLLADHPGSLVLAGGFIRAIVAGERPTDVDLFTANPDHQVRLARVLAAGLPGARPPYLSPRSATVHWDGAPVQVMDRWYFDHPAELVGKFDLTISMAALWRQEDGWASCADPRFYRHVADRRLCYTNPEREEVGGEAMLRVLKFYRRGYRISLPDLAVVIGRLVGPEDVEEIHRRLRASDQGSDLSENLAYFRD